MARVESIYACSACGATAPKWLGRCPDCGSWNTLVEEPKSGRKRAPARLRLARKPEFIAEIAGDSAPMQPSGIAEFDRVTGGGLVAGSVTLLGGEPGIGKSTLVLQVADHFGRTRGPVLYISGEESAGQIKRRADRLAIEGHTVALLTASDLDEIQAAIEQTKPVLLVLDSIQTTSSSLLESPAGTVGQVRAVASELARAAKTSQMAVLLIGHVTKEGSLAGPKVLEHLVDTVLNLESDTSRHYRLLRATKNRFGSIDEIGLFEMSSGGMLPVADPSHLFLSADVQPQVGSVVVSAVEGTRPLLFDLQGLVAPAGFGTPQRVARGFDNRRLAMLLAVIERRGGLKLAGHDVFVNVTGGLTIDEPALDLGVILALASSYLDSALPPRTLVVGEVGLGGEVRAVGQLPRRLSEAAKLGFRSVVVPELGGDPDDTARSPLRLVPIASVADAIEWLSTC